MPGFFSDLPAPPAPPQPAPFTPTFEIVGMHSTSSGNFIINDTYYATQETAAWLMHKFGAAWINIVPDPPNPDGYNIILIGDVADENKPAFQRFLVFQPGTPLLNAWGLFAGVVQKQFLINAGLMAQAYRANPESQFPAQSGVYGFPPIPWHFLSNAERTVWDMLMARSITG